MTLPVGIEALGIAIPRRYLELSDLAQARGVEPAKFTVGLGAIQMAVPEPGEDTVALAATAAQRLIERNRIDPARIGMLIVGTETGVDHSKPVASFVQGILGLPRTVRTFDTQHACYGGTAALMSSAAWVASGAARGKSALVICSDIARYGLNTAGEPTQGGGAVAMLVSSTPEVLALDFGLSGVGSADVHDFWRPLGRREALVDGHYSIQCYLDALSTAYRGWKTLAQERGLLHPEQGLASEQLARVLYHVPFCKMAKKAHEQVRRCDLEDKRGPLSAEDLAEEAPRSAASFAKQVAPSLSLCARVGNVYTGSLYLGIAGLLHAEAATLAGQRLGLLSYGSGCCSEFFSGVVGESAAARLAALDIDALLASRERISVAEYESIMGLPSDAPLPATAGDGFRFAGIREHRRSYEPNPR
jgi:hydroxymethylglutaryl-CoA synthase